MCVIQNIECPLTIWKLSQELLCIHADTSFNSIPKMLLKKLKGKIVTLIYDIVASCKIAKVKRSTAMDASITDSHRNQRKKKNLQNSHLQNTCLIYVLKEMHLRTSEHMFNFGPQIREMEGKQCQREVRPVSCCQSKGHTH